MTRPLIVAVACLAVACRPDPPAVKTEPYQPRITPTDLQGEYHSGKNRTGKRVVMTLNPKCYTVTRSGIHWYTVLPDLDPPQLPPTIVFVCQPPPDNSRFLELTGVVRGATWDETDRGSGVRFQVAVDVTGLVVR